MDAYFWPLAQHLVLDLAKKIGEPRSSQST